MTRQRLLNRRGHELLTFEHVGFRYTVGVGRFEDGTLAEIFLNTAKQGTAIDVNARDNPLRLITSWSADMATSGTACCRGSCLAAG
jgi:hypothetical protein